MTTPEARARQVALNIWLNCKCGSDYNQELAGQLIATQIRQAQAEVWAEVKQQCEKMLDIGKGKV